MSVEELMSLSGRDQDRTIDDMGLDEIEEMLEGVEALKKERSWL